MDPITPGVFGTTAVTPAFVPPGYAGPYAAAGAPTPARGPGLAVNATLSAALGLAPNNAGGGPIDDELRHLVLRDPVVDGPVLMCVELLERGDARLPADAADEYFKNAKFARDCFEEAAKDPDRLQRMAEVLGRPKQKVKKCHGCLRTRMADTFKFRYHAATTTCKRAS